MLKRLIIAIYIILTLLFSLGVALAAPCDVTSATDFIEHDLTLSPATSNSYCELCGTGYVELIISNTFDEDTTMTNMTVVENLGDSGLTYGGSMEAWVNSAAVVGPPGPVASGANNRILTWNPGLMASIVPLGRLDANSNPGTATTIRFRF